MSKRQEKELPMTEIIDKYLKGATIAELCKAYNIRAYAVLWRKLKKANVHKPKRSYRVFLPTDAMTDEYLSGATLQELASKHGVSVALVYRRLEEAGVERRSRGRKLLDLPMDVIFEEYSNGASASELCRKYNCSHNTIMNRLHREYDITPHKGGRPRILSLEEVQQNKEVQK